jgi:hypothetical protein
MDNAQVLWSCFEQALTVLTTHHQPAEKEAVTDASMKSFLDNGLPHLQGSRITVSQLKRNMAMRLRSPIRSPQGTESEMFQIWIPPSAV